MKLRHFLLGIKAMTNLDSILKNRHYFSNKGPFGQVYDFSNSYVWMWTLGHKESLSAESGCFCIMVLESTLEIPLDCWEIKPVNANVNQSWIFIGRIVAEAEAQILWKSDMKKWLTGKDPDLEKDGGQEEKRVTEDEMTGWHHWLNGHAFEQTLGGQGSLACAVHWVAKSQTRLSDWTELNSTQLNSVEAGKKALLKFNTNSWGEKKNVLAN